MTRLLLCLSLLTLAACTRPNAAVKEASIAEVAEYVKSGNATILDANDDEYRQSVGFVPGAVLLTSYREYDVAKTLPADKTRPLVFYCTSRT